MSIKVDQIVRSDRKTLEVQISIEGHIIVRAPMDESMESIENYLDEKKFKSTINRLSTTTKTLWFSKKTTECMFIQRSI